MNTKKYSEQGLQIGYDCVAPNDTCVFLKKPLGADKTKTWSDFHQAYAEVNPG